MGVFFKDFFHHPNFTPQDSGINMYYKKPVKIDRAPNGSRSIPSIIFQVRTCC